MKKIGLQTFLLCTVYHEGAALGIHLTVCECIHESVIEGSTRGQLPEHRVNQRLSWSDAYCIHLGAIHKLHNPIIFQFFNMLIQENSQGKNKGALIFC